MEYRKDKVPRQFTVDASELIRRSFFMTIVLTIAFFLLGQFVKPIKLFSKEPTKQNVEYKINLCNNWSVIEALADSELFFNITSRIVEHSVMQTMSTVNANPKSQKIKHIVRRDQNKNQFSITINGDFENGGEQILRHTASTIQSNLAKDFNRVTVTLNATAASKRFSAHLNNIVTEKGAFVVPCGSQLTTAASEYFQLLKNKLLERLLTSTVFALLISLSFHLALALVNRPKPEK